MYSCKCIHWEIMTMQDHNSNQHDKGMEGCYNFNKGDENDIYDEISMRIMSINYEEEE